MNHRISSTIDYSKLDVLSPNEVISCLWNKNSTEKCRIGLADYILYESGLPVRWYITGKTGEVMKKRGIGSDIIAQRWDKISTHTKSAVVAIIRQKGGFFKFLGKDAWSAFVSDLKNPDPSIISLHCFVQGNSQMIYRNRFELRDKLGRFSTWTSAYQLPLEQIPTAPLITISENDLHFTDSKATSIKSVMDLATNTVIRYVESMLTVKVVSLSIDYVIDNNSQLWMLWSSDLRFVRGSNLREMEVPGLPTGVDPIGRSSFLGPPSPSHSSSRPASSTVQVTSLNEPSLSSDFTSLQPSPSRRRTASDEEFSMSENNKKLSRMFGSQINAASTVLDSSEEIQSLSRLGSASGLSMTSGDSMTAKKKFSRELNSKFSVTTQSSKPSSVSESPFPEPFKCKGDYCQCRLQSVGNLLPNPDTKEFTVEKLFTKKEIDSLRKNKNFSQIMQFGADGPALATITKRSILLARQEQRLVTSEDNEAVWKEYPFTPRQKNPLLQSEASKGLSGSSSSSSLGSQASSAQSLPFNNEEQEFNRILSSDKAQRESFTRDMAGYYERVRVCGVCFQVYALLDRARTLLGHGDAYGAGLEGRGAAFPTQERESRKGPRDRSHLFESDVRSSSSAEGPREDSSSTRRATSRRSERVELPVILSKSVSSEGFATLQPSSNSSNVSGKNQQQLVFSASSDSILPKSVHPINVSPIEGRLNARNKKSKPKTWKDYSHVAPGTEKADASTLSELSKKAEFSKLNELDDYLRVGSQALIEKKEREKESFMNARVTELLNSPEYAQYHVLEQQRQSKLPQDSGSVSQSGSTVLHSDPSLLRGIYRGKVLFACEENEDSLTAISILENAYFDVTVVRDGRKAVNSFSMRLGDGSDGEKITGISGGFDCLIAQRNCPLLDAFKITEIVRDAEESERKKISVKAAKEGIGTNLKHKRCPVICYTPAVNTSPEDLKQYMRADMDGCVSSPVNKVSLLNTIRAAIPHHLALTNPSPLEEESRLEQGESSKVYKSGPLGTSLGAVDSSSLAVKSLSLGSSSVDDCATFGVVQIDADTRVPYAVMDSLKAMAHLSSIDRSRQPFFNLVVINDMFDTYERMKIFLRPIVQRYVGMQVLLWNYPGQAFTEWRGEQLLNNEYISACLNEVLGQVGEKGTGDFDTSRPFYIMGFGFGANIASFYSSHYRVPNLRGLLSVNGWSYVDSYLAGVMHDCMNVFQCSPPARPDLPIYFYSRFLFSKDYLSKVSVPLALNIYTAINNPISLKGRINLCKGVLQSVDTRPLLREIDCPLICLQSTQDSLARPLHMEPFVLRRNGETRSIFAALRDSTKTCVIWIKSGHEVFQENKKQTQVLVEQLLTGFHESHEINFPPASVVDSLLVEQGGTMISSLPWENDKKANNTIEDKFIDGVMKQMKSTGDILKTEKKQQQEAFNKDLRATSPSKSNRPSSNVSFVLSNDDSLPPIGGSQSKQLPSNSVIFSSQSDPSLGAWEEYSRVISESTPQMRGKSEKNNKTSKRKENISKSTAGPNSMILNPSLISFEKQGHSHYSTPGAIPASGSVVGGRPQNIHEYSEVKEYMSWRLKRNKKRLQRLQGAARVIQNAFRAWIARNIVKRARKDKSARIIQRFFRGFVGRCKFLEHARKLWAVALIQRVWRGYVARKIYFERRVRMAAATNIQRLFRGHLARLMVNEIKRIRDKAASLIQAMFRRNKARKEAWCRRNERNAAITVQRVFRGHMGRARANAEKDKYIFSKSQSQGIEFGRQMLLEHKLHATKLQSDVTLLTQEKVAAEEQVEALLEEISSFDEGVRTLEKEMHQLSKVESEAAAYMDDDSRFELREQKVRLDREFGEMLSKISNRKEMLVDLEKKLNSIDKARQGKEEELRTLERKLVVLLEEQQNELNMIKRKQDVRGALLAASHEELMKATAGNPGAQSSTVSLSTNSLAGGGQGGGSSGPSLQEKRQAAQLMQSTETLMKFGFMSMSMTYFSSLNMIKALRTVSAQDTVMAALADVHTQRAVGFGTVEQTLGGSSGSHGKDKFLPDLKPGQLGGQDSLRVSAWSVEDVAKWLNTISLGQYSEAFIDAAIDGEFLYDLNDEDLKNTLGIEHRLHRKKILNCVHRLKLAEARTDSRLHSLLQDQNLMNAPDVPLDLDDSSMVHSDAFGGATGGKTDIDADRRLQEGPKVSLDELFSLVRHSKVSLIREALDYLPSKTFDKSLVQVGYVADHGTVYVEGYERLSFHLNKTDDFGNTLLSMACQNGNQKICKYLVAKGANPNHQNKAGQTPAHFAIAFKFFELSQWLFANGASDVIENKFGLVPYDGMTPDHVDQ